ncbi:multidrug effflux MFS transporter [Naumannella halotolerans]|uniref:DHA1 family bicyclomycin/chloramphenicol resistance-like MFS transporter n=1 Tax=Naumannella halotolerans TaxID=993414 RepID=A0A4R7J4Q1_9ACTN|nr:multidrug effflux MFS transporter [Naumannella halotolerans]TDT31323.1 DHA1 family bicyclomycin/chloramphenicol resistance-like MFS transporter [Naumannella halotolerans]
MTAAASVPLKRWQATIIPLVLALLGMLGPFSIDTPYPGFESIQHEFGVGNAETQQLVAAYMLAFAVMSILHGPLSDAIGRRPVVLGGLSVYALASLGAVFAPNMAVLIACRVLQGLAAGGGVIVSRAMVRDLYAGPMAQKLMSRVMMIFGLAPAIAPIIGGVLVTSSGWRSVFGFMTGIGVLLVAVVILCLPETHPVERRTELSVRGLLRSLFGVFRTPSFHRVAWTGSLMFGAYFLYIGAAAIVVVDLLGQGPNDFWKLFVPMIIGFTGGAFVGGRLAGRISIIASASMGLAITITGALTNTVLMSFPALQGLPWAVVGPFLLGFGASIGFPSMQVIVMDQFPAHRGAATSAATFLTLVLNALGAGLLAPVMARSLFTMAAVGLGYTLAAGLLWAWHLWLARAGRVGTAEA